MTEAPPGWTAIDDVAERFKVTDATARRWARDGLLPGAMKVGRAWIVPTASVEKFEKPKMGNPAWTTKESTDDDG